MNWKLNKVAAVILAACVAGTYASASDATPPKKHPRHRKAVPAGPSVEEQIQALRNQLQGQQGQIDQLKSDLSNKDQQLQQAQQQAADAQAQAAKAEAAASSISDNTAAVNSLQSTVSDLKANQASLATTVSDETTHLKQKIEHPDDIYFKGITISPTGSFIEAATVWRSAATGGDINTQMTGIPLQYADAANLSEFQGSGRQSRLALKATGKLDNLTLTGYYEMDWLGAGATSNNNQSNSYVMRMRQLWAQAALASGWKFTGGQMWSLATETTHGLDNGTEILPSTIDPQYEAGFVWERQYGFRVTKDFGNSFFAGISAEGAQTLSPAGSGMGTNVLLGQLGNSGGLYNAFNADISYNVAPDVIAKIAFEPGWGHWEVFNISRFFRDRIYPNATSSATTSSAAGAFNDYAYGDGIGGGFRGPVAGGKVTVGLKGLWGKGIGRYGDSTIADITLAPWGGIVPLKAFSALSTVELNPTPRLNIYLNYGGDYVYRQTAGGTWGYGSYLTNMSGCNTEVAVPTGTGPWTPETPANCGNQNKDVQEATVGYWYNIYKGDKGRFRQGFQYSYITRNLWSGVGGTTNPSGSAEGTDNVIETSLRYYLP
jgi:Skp family chaperone for outer membrane proteins